MRQLMLDEVEKEQVLRKHQKQKNKPPEEEKVEIAERQMHELLKLQWLVRLLKESI